MVSQGVMQTPMVQRAFKPPKPRAMRSTRTPSGADSRIEAARRWLRGESQLISFPQELDRRFGAELLSYGGLMVGDPDVDPRFLSPAMPRAYFGGVKISF